MVRQVRSFGKILRAWLERPDRVVLCCGIFAALHLLFQGNLFHLVQLHSDRTTLAASIIGEGRELIRLQREIRRSKESNFIEREAKDRLDMAGEDELVFVFSSD